MDGDGREKGGGKRGGGWVKRGWGVGRKDCAGLDGDQNEVGSIHVIKQGHHVGECSPPLSCSLVRGEKNILTLYPGVCAS